MLHGWRLSRAPLWRSAASAPPKFHNFFAIQRSEPPNCGHDCFFLRNRAGGIGS